MARIPNIRTIPEMQPTITTLTLLTTIRAIITQAITGAVILAARIIADLMAAGTAAGLTAVEGIIEHVSWPCV